jgi:pyruvate dehydrogenase E1 component beta subunit
MSSQTETRQLTFSQAVNEAIREEMDRDHRVILFGEDVAAAGGVWKVTDGLLDRFGAERVLDTPISEAGIAGLGVGAAMTGLRPIVEIMFGDFLPLASDQIVNQAAKTYYMSGGMTSVPMVFLTSMGAGRRLAAQHSQSLQAWFAHIPGLKVVLPSSPHDAKGLMKTAIRDENPVIFLQDKVDIYKKGPVPDPSHEYTIPFGRADVKRKGDDLTLIATSSMVWQALDAASELADEGIESEVVDPRTLAPLDEEALLDSVRKTARCLVIDEGYQRYGAGAEIAALIGENLFYDLEAPVRRLGAMDVPVPFSPTLEDLTIPRKEQIVEIARQMFED